MQENIQAKAELKDFIALLFKHEKGNPLKVYFRKVRTYYKICREGLSLRVWSCFPNLCVDGGNVMLLVCAIAGLFHSHGL